MEGNDASEKVNLNQVVEIVSSYVRQNTIAAEELPRLIADVGRLQVSGSQHLCGNR
jgi:predicted transcriptional regulator